MSWPVRGFCGVNDTDVMLGGRGPAAEAGAMPSSSAAQAAASGMNRRITRALVLVRRAKACTDIHPP